MPINISLAKAISSGSSAYIRLQVKDRPGVLGKITTAFGRKGISLESVVQGAEAAYPFL